MQLLKTWILRGANRWASVPVFEVEFDLGPKHTEDVRGATGFLKSLVEHVSSAAVLTQRPGPVSLHEVLSHLVIEFQRVSGIPVQFCTVRPTASAGHCRLIFEFEEEAIAQASLTLAWEFCQSLSGGTPIDVRQRLAALRELANDVRLGPSSMAIVRAAQTRAIPYRRLTTGSSLVVLGQAAKQRRVCTAETDATSAIAENIAQDKELTRNLLRSVGVPVPEGRPVADVADAWRAAEELGLPVVVKPQYGNHGRGVATNLRTREQVEKAYAAALAEGEHIMVEQFIEGFDHRLLVIGGKLVAAALREPAQVAGDGIKTIRQLIEDVNRDPRRSDGHATVLSFIKLDAIGLEVLADQGLTPDSVPPTGQKVLIRRNGNLSTGGTATDLTDEVHPDVAARAEDAARVVGLDIAGVDVVARDLRRPLEEQRGAAVEVNAGPGLRMHIEPSAGKPRPVGEAIISMLFPGSDGRIPVVAVSGVNGKTTTTRLVAHLLKGAGHVVGMTCTDGLYVDGRRIDTRDCSGPRSARAVLLNPAVTAAVLETARGGIIREGLGFDRCDAAVITNIADGDHLGLRGVETLDDLAQVKGVVVEAVAPHGAAVLNADDPLTASMAPRCPGSVVFFTRDAANPTVTVHRAKGRKAVLTRDGMIVLADGRTEAALLPLAACPMTYGGKVNFQIENTLAAVAAAWSLDISQDDMRRGLVSFIGDATQAPGRFNVFHRNNATVIVDYAHNPSALAALIASLDQFAHDRRTFVFAGCNRRDADVIEMGQIVGNGFDRVVLYTDQSNHDRSDGDLQALLRQGLSRGTRARTTLETAGEMQAIERALDELTRGELVVIGVERIDEALMLVQERLARQCEGSPR